MKRCFKRDVVKYVYSEIDFFSLTANPLFLNIAFGEFNEIFKKINSSVHSILFGFCI